jgi:predicted dehydrogenase
MPNWSWDGWMQDPKRSGGVACDLHIHDLDFMVYALGAPKSHKSYRTQYPGKDYIFATYDYGDFFVNIEAAWYGSPHPFHSGFSFQFEKAVITWDKAFKAIYLENGEIIDLSQPEPEALGGMNIMNTPSHEREFKYFVDCIKAGKPADMIKPEELEAVLAEIEAYVASDVVKAALDMPGNEVEEPETETPEAPEGEENEGAGEEAPEEEPEEEKVYTSVAFFYDKWLASKSLKVVEPTV